jgi:hypothetical protein
MGLFSSKKEINELEKKIYELSNKLLKIEIELLLKNYKHIIDLLIKSDLAVIHHHYYWVDNYNGIYEKQLIKHYATTSELKDFDNLVIKFLYENKITEQEFLKCVKYLRYSLEYIFKEPNVDIEKIINNNKHNGTIK